MLGGSCVLTEKHPVSSIFPAPHLVDTLVVNTPGMSRDNLNVHGHSSSHGGRLSAPPRMFWLFRKLLSAVAAGFYETACRR